MLCGEIRDFAGFGTKVFAASVVEYESKISIRVICFRAFPDRAPVKSASGYPRSGGLITSIGSGCTDATRCLRAEECSPE
jgi:hypothetical protein